MLSILQVYNANLRMNFIATKNIGQGDFKKSSENSTMNFDRFTMSKSTLKSEDEHQLNRLKQVTKDAIDDKKGAVARIKAMKIAKKIARGERVSSSEIKFIREVDSNAYIKAKYANFKRKNLELRLKYKSKFDSNLMLDNEEIHALTDSDKEQAGYSAEGVREVRKRKKMKYNNRFIIGHINEKI